eukprot:scaffold627_cov55-Attheya_sp.AAC.1
MSSNVYRHFCKSGTGIGRLYHPMGRKKRTKNEREEEGTDQGNVPVWSNGIGNRRYDVGKTYSTGREFFCSGAIPCIR